MSPRAPVEQLAEHFSLSPQQVGGLITQLRINPKLFPELRSMGYAEKQIPPWVARPEATAAPAAPIPMQQQQQQQADLAGRADLAELEQPEPVEIPAPRTGIPRSPAPASAQPGSQVAR